MVCGFESKDEKRKYEGFDNIFSEIPHFKSYQFLLLLAAAWLCIIGGLVQTGSVFLQANPEEYRCKNYIDETFPNESDFSTGAFGSTLTSCKKWDIDWETECSESVTLEDYEKCFEQNDLANSAECTVCSEYVYSPNNTFTQTVVTQFHWVCDDANIPISSVSTCIFMCGLFFGALGLGNLSDAIGRKNTMLVSVIGSVIVNTGLIFVNDPFAFTFVRLLAGAFAHGGVVVGYVWIMEFVGPNSRSWIGAHYLSIFSIGFAFLSLVGYYARDWHDMQIWIVCFCAPYFVIHFFIPTSHRWLYSKQKQEQARAELKQFAKNCNVDLNDDFIEKVESKTADLSTLGNYTSADLMKWPKMRKISFNSGYCWFVTSMVYYGLGLNAGSLAGNIFMNNILNAVLEIIGRCLIPFLMEWKVFGRKRSLALCFLLLGISCLSAMLLNLNSGCNPPPNDTCYPADDILECNETMQSAGKAMAFIGKFAVACCFSILYTFSAELYPTCVRSSALGLNSSMARVGGAVSPLMFGLDGTIPWFSNTIFASLAFIAAISSLFLPETLGMPMSQTMEEAESNYFKTPEDIEREREEAEKGLKNDNFKDEEL